MKKKYLFLFLFPIMLVFNIRPAWSYANFVAYGYTSCLTCHYNALGGGPLTDYGRAVSAVAVSGRLIYSATTTDEKLGEMSNFYFGKWNGGTWFRPSINVRGLRYTTDVFKSNKVSRNILMQAEGNIVLKFLKNDKLVFSGSYGHVPDYGSSTKKPGEKEEKNLISREHYIQVAPNSFARFYLGFLDKAYGLRIPDHIAYSRKSTGLSENDQSHGFITHVTPLKKWELTMGVFLGSLFQEKDLRQKGYSFTTEYEPAAKLRLGASAISSTNKYLKIFMNSFHFRVGFGEGASIISELGQISKLPINSDVAKTMGVYNFTQAQLQLRRGLNMLTTYEYYRSNILKAVTTNYRLGLGFQYFPIQRIEFRFDLVNTRTFSNTSVIPDRWDFMNQLHLWF
jgi:hypothetical protein